LDLLGRLLHTFGEDIKGPDAISFCEGKKQLFVLTPVTQTVHVFNLVGEFIHKWQYERKTSFSPSLSASNIAVSENLMFISDLIRDQVSVFDHFGKVITTLGHLTDPSTEFDEPRGLLVRDNLLHVGDRRNYQIHVYHLPELTKKRVFAHPVPWRIQTNGKHWYSLMRPKSPICILETNRMIDFGLYSKGPSEEEVDFYDMALTWDVLYVTDTKQKCIFVYV